MANETFTAIQTTVATPGFDADGDGVIDPGEIVTTTVTITNNSTTPTPVAATDVQFTEDLQGMTLVNQAGDDINASPIAFDDSYTAAGNVAFTGVAMLNNDAEPLGPEGLALNAGTAIQNTGVAFATTQGGSVTLNANGTFTYISAVGFEGVDTFTYTLRDTGLDAVAGNADDLSGTGTVSITVGPSVWFIDNTAAPGGNGTQASPFNSIAAFNLAQGTANGPDAGDFIYLRQGTGTYSEANGINLATGQTLIGQGQNLVVNGVTIEVGSAGLTPTIQVTGADEGVLLAQNNTLSGFNISTTNAAADGIEDGGGTVGTLTISNVSIAGTGQAVDIDQGGTLNVTLASVTSTGSSEQGIQLAGVAGSFTASTVSLNGMTGDGIDLDNNSATVAINGGTIGNSNDPGGIGVDINGGAGNVTISATINKSSAGAVEVVEVTGRTGGTVDFNANITSSGGGGGIDINANTGGTVRFDGGMNLSTGTAAAFNASGNTSTTVVVTDTASTSNILSTTTGTALNVANTTIGAEDLTFQSISANGASSGIVLSSTGNLGGLTVTGDGGNTNNGSGGTIQNTTGDGVSLTSTMDVNLARMNITNNLGDGIGGSTINGMVLNRLNISGNGNDAATDESGINIVDLTGSASNGAHPTAITNSVISSNFEFEVQITNHSGTLTNLQFLNNTVTAAITAGVGGNVFNFLGDGTSTMGLTVSGGSFTGNYNPASPPPTVTGTGVHADTSGTAMTVNVSGATFTGNNAGVNVSTGPGSSNLTFDIDGNTFIDTRSTAINIFNNGNAPFNRTVNGTITDNMIGDGTDFSGSTVGRGIDVGNEGAVNLTVLISGNTIQDIGTPGINSSGSSAIGSNIGLGGAATGGGTTNLTITNNNISDIQDSRAILVDESQDTTGGGPFPTVFVNISGNTIGGFIGGQAGDGSRIRLDQDNGIFKVTQGAPGSGAGSIDSANIGVTAAEVSVGGTVLFNQGTPPLPSTNPLPLLAGEGGMETANTDPTDISTDTEQTISPPTHDTLDVPPATDAPAHIGTQTSVHPVIVDDGVLTQAELDYFVNAAIARWSEAGLTETQLDALEAMSFGVADMSGLNLGAFAPTQITLDADAAGRGWYLDGTPLDDAEFGTIFSTTWMQTTPTGAPAGHYDLLTTVMHEMGHALGLGDRYEGTARDALMYGWLFTGERRLPGAGDADGAVAGAITSEEFLGAPIDIGVLPAGKQVIIQWQATIDPQTNQLIVNPVNTGTVSATNAVGFPDQNTNTVTTTLDTLILGGTIWNDNGAGGGTPANGIKDGTEPGVSGVTLSLFVDANDDNVPDSPGSPLVTGVLTNGSGDYSFTGLAPGNYIVRVDQDNFDALGNTSLFVLGLQDSPTTIPEPPDPDDGNPDVDNDDNGSRAPNQPAFSKSITLAYNTEPTVGTGNDTNTTLDFGFITPPTADLSVSKTVSDATPNVGDQIVYTITVTNVGPNAATGVQVTDLLPAGVTFATATPGQGTYDSTTGLWDVGALANGAQTVLTIGATVVSPAAQTNTGTISDADQFDPDAANNTASATETPQQADLSVTKTVSDATPNVGDQIVYTITVTNVGPDAATGVQVTDLLPAGVTFATATPGQGTYNSTTGLWDVGALANGATTVLTIGATVVSSAAQTNTGTISDADQFDPDAANNTASATETPQQADLSVTKTVSDATPNVGDQIVYTITVTNVGPNAATGVQVTDLLPAGVTFATATPGQGTYNSTTGLWDVGALANGATTVLTIGATVVSSAAQTNTGTISDADQFDPDAANNTASAFVDADDPPVLQDDAVTTAENAVLNGSVFADNGSGPDSDPDTPLVVSAVNGNVGNVNNTILLASGALLTVNANGNFTYNPNGAFDHLPAPGSGASNTSAVDTFTYTVNPTANVTVTVTGVDSDDTLIGTAGIDNFSGGIGNDLYFVGNTGDGVNEAVGAGYDTVAATVDYTIPVNVEALYIIGAGLTGTGSASVDSLLSSGGANTLIGLLGDDLYFVNNSGDTVTEGAGGGLDKVIATASYVMPSEVEALYLVGAGLIGTGSGDADELLSSGGANTMVGLGGNDIYFVNSIGDVVTEGAGGGLDTVIATTSYIIPSEVEALFMNGAGLTGTGSGNVDTLLSTGGANILAGLGGNDIYFVNNIGDAVMENAGDGLDTVEATVSYTLPANAEALYMLGSGLTGTGTNNAESLLSSGGANTLVGLGGDDLYYVNNIGDTVTEAAGGGFDIVMAGANYALPAEVEALFMIGSGLTGTGSGGADSLLSSGGPNTLVGLDGDDLYYVNNTADVVTEAANGGFDSVLAFVTYTLPTNVEALYMIGSGLTGTGSSGADTLVTVGANTLVGDDGNDTFVFSNGSADGATVADFDGDEGDVLVFSGFGTVAQGASFDPIGANQWEIFSGLDAHTETITLANGAAPDTGDFFFV